MARRKEGASRGLKTNMAFIFAVGIPILSAILTNSGKESAPIFRMS
jgi:hypothetical protein